MYNDIPEKHSGYADGFYRPLSAFMAGLREANEKRDIPIIRRDTEMFLRSILALRQPRNILEIGTACGYSALFFAGLLSQVQITSLEIKEAYAAEAAVNIQRAQAYARGAADVPQGLSFAGRIRLIQADASAALPQLAAAARAAPPGHPPGPAGQTPASRLSGPASQAEKPASASQPEQPGPCQAPPSQDGPFDMIFLDGPKSHYLKHFQLAVPLMADEALILSDNILLGGMMTGEAPVSRRNLTMVRRMDAYLRYITNLPGFETSVLALGDGIAVTRRTKAAGSPPLQSRT